MNNLYQLSDDGSYYIIYFKDGESFFIDRDDFSSVSKRSWNHGKRGYPTSTIRSNENGKKTSRSQTLHKYILAPPKGVDVDHISGNKLDNRRVNLRLCTHQQNMFNQKKRNTNSTGFTGVSFLKCAGKYEAYVHCGGVKHHLGLFTSLSDAASVRDKAASRLFGDYARLNTQAELNAKA